MTASPKPSGKTPWKVSDEVVGRGNDRCKTLRNIECSESDLIESEYRNRALISSVPCRVTGHTQQSVLTLQSSVCYVCLPPLLFMNLTMSLLWPRSTFLVPVRPLANSGALQIYHIKSCLTDLLTDYNTGSKMLLTCPKNQTKPIRYANRILNRLIHD